MINIWEYANSLPRIKLRANDDQVFVGKTIMVWDAEETDDDEDSITIEMDDGVIRTFYPSEIAEIEVL